MGDEGGHDGGSRARTGDPGRRPPHLLLHRHGGHRADPLANTDRWKGGRKRRTRNERRDTEAVIAGGRLTALLLSVFPGADADPNRGRSLARAGRRKPVGRSGQAAATGFFNSWSLVLEGQERRKRWENRSAATFCQQLGSFATRAGRQCLISFLVRILFTFVSRRSENPEQQAHGLFALTVQGNCYNT